MDMCARFRELHGEGTFVLPNPWDIGSAKILESLGFAALATTSSGHAATFGKLDQEVTFDQLLAHAEDLVAAISVPLNLDSERCFGDTLAEITANVQRMGDTGAAGCSIEDYNPATGGIDPIEMAVDRVAAAAAGVKASGMVLTGRCENHLYGIDDLDDTIARLIAYREAGAEALYAPGFTDLAVIEQVVTAVGAPVNVLASPRGPSVDQLRSVGVRRVSTGSGPARSAYGALIAAGNELLNTGTSQYVTSAVAFSDLPNYFGN